MGSTPSAQGATQQVGHDIDGSILVLKVWREPAFKARITVDRSGSAPAARTVVATTEAAVIDYVRQWLRGARGA